MQYWALAASVALHTTVLAVFTGVRFSGPPQPSDQPPALSLRAIARAAAEPKPVPRVAPIVPIARPKAEPAAEQPPVVAKVNAEPETPISPEPTQPEISGSEVESADISSSGAAEVELFGQKSVVQQIAYVVDCSGSMYGQMYLVKEQLKRSILNLSAEQAFCILFFMDGRTVMMSGQGQLQPAGVDSKAEALQLIAQVKPKGSTDAANALELALRLKGADGRGPEVIYFLTDGFDLKEFSSDELISRIEALRQAFVPGSIIHTIGFGPAAKDRAMLLSMAQNTGGGYVEIH
ncbi:MAG: VWA domain-containing protein [Planctomycetaceae bacterium]|nr:VWA domain-containing protein [Planctomycetaceae bacterium]